jgi:hypothetical protein
MYKQSLEKDGKVSTHIIVRVADNAYIPCDPANSDYQQYLVWVAAGNTITSA